MVASPSHLGGCEFNFVFYLHDYERQKNRDGLAWFARQATAWLLEKIKERKSVKGQAQEETCKSTRNWKIKERNAVRDT